LSTESKSLLEVVVTARPSWARVKTLVQSYSKIAGADSVRVSLLGPAISRRYGDISSDIPNNIQLNKFPTLLESDTFLDVTLSSLNGAEALSRYWSINTPDCVLVVADRTETLGVSLAATLMQIPLVHLQGGEISGSIDDIIRNANTKLADLHLTTNQESLRFLLNLGESESNIRVVGCPSLDLVLQSEVLPHAQLHKLWNSIGVGAEFKVNIDFSIIMFHPDTFNLQENEEWIDSIIRLTRNVPEHNWLWFWPNTDHGSDSISKKLRKQREIGLLSNVRFMINIQPEKFIQLARSSRCLIGNSSFGIREASFLGLPTLNLGKRQNGRQRGLNCVNILKPNELNLTVFEETLKTRRYPREYIYGSGDSGLRSARAIFQWQPKKKSQ